jgi:hypothetical protein
VISHVQCRLSEGYGGVLVEGHDPSIGNLLGEAEEMYMRALRGREKAWRLDHMSTLDTAHSLGLLYKNQGKIVKAEEMYVWALRGYEKAVGKDHPRTQNIARNLQRLHAHK